MRCGTRSRYRDGGPNATALAKVGCPRRAFLQESPKMRLPRLASGPREGRCALAGRAALAGGGSGEPPRGASGFVQRFCVVLPRLDASGTVQLRGATLANDLGGRTLLRESAAPWPAWALVVSCVRVDVRRDGRPSRVVHRNALPTGSRPAAATLTEMGPCESSPPFLSPTSAMLIAKTHSSGAACGSPSRPPTKLESGSRGSSASFTPSRGRTAADAT